MTCHGVGHAFTSSRIPQCHPQRGFLTAEWCSAEPRAYELPRRSKHQNCSSPSEVASVQSALWRPAPILFERWTRRRRRLFTPRAKPGFDERLERSIALLVHAAETHRGRIVQASSLGAEDQVVTDLIARFDLPIVVATLDTGKLHPRDARPDRRRARSLRHRHRALPAGPRADDLLRRAPRRRRDVPERRAAQGLLRDEEARAARAPSRGARRLGHRPAARAVERAWRRAVRIDRRARPAPS